MNEAAKQLFDMSEENLKNFHLSVGETMQEAEDRETQKSLELQAKMVNAIGAWRFPETWNDGLPEIEYHAPKGWGKVTV